MRKQITLIFISFILLVLSFLPLFYIVREALNEQFIQSRYDIRHAYQDEHGFESIIDVQELTIHGMNIKIIEEPTGLKAPLTQWDKDENVAPGDIIEIQFLLNDMEISSADEIWLSNRNRGSRYFSWLDILTVKDRITGEKEIKIIQRLTDDFEMNDRKWKLISISSDEKVEEEEITYEKRRDNKLGVKIINFSNTSLMAMGYYSDITKGYPNLFFPILYPFLSSLLGFILLMIAVIRLYRRGSDVKK